MKNFNSIDAKEEDYLYRGTSQLQNAGEGLFTAIAIYKEETIAIFKGEVLSDKEALVRSLKGKDQYFIGLLNGRIMDSMNVACFAKYANDAEGYPDSGKRNNSKIALDDYDNVCIVASRNIKANEELFCGYGVRYWKKHRLI